MTGRVSVAASWVLPIAGPAVARGWVSSHQGRIERVGTGAAPEGARDLGDVVLLPGLVNAHTHLELSWMAGRIPPADTMSAWIRTMLALRRTGPTGGEGELQTALRSALATMRSTGTVVVGDISNTLASVQAFDDTAMAATVFHEILGFNPADPAGLVREAHCRLRDVRCLSSVAGHAPYSTSPELFRQIVTHHQGPAPLTVHLAESNDEMELLHTGEGPMRVLLEALDVWNDTWVPPGRHPVRYLRELGYLQPGTLLVHGVHLSPDDIEEARHARAVIVTCPRSNVWVGGGVPPVARFYASGIDVAIGTDSLASVDSLNMFDELAALRRLAPEVEAARLLESATRIGAKALGHGADYGTLAPGRVAHMVAVQVPPGVTRAADVEEYLVSGVPASSVSLVDLAPR